MEDKSNQVITKQSSPDQLPDNVHTLREMVLTLLADVDDKNVRLMDMESQLAWFKRHTFGRRSEKYLVDHPVLFDLLGQNESPAESPKAPAKSEPSDGKSRRNGRKPLPAHLPREQIEWNAPGKLVQF